MNDEQALEILSFLTRGLKENPAYGTFIYLIVKDFIGSRGGELSINEEFFDIFNTRKRKREYLIHFLRERRVYSLRRDS